MSQGPIDRLLQSLPETRNDRIKLVAAVIVIGACTAWLGYFLLSSSGGGGRTQALDTPGWRLVQDLNTKLNERAEFKDVGFAVESERPLKLRVNGAVHRAADLPELESFLKELRPEADYELHVEVLR